MTIPIAEFTFIEQIINVSSRQAIGLMKVAFRS
jgi:hypothetical protein